ncbi:MAG: hypothetical protein ACYS7M_07680 [Planctomycetota bacterium]|jgi:hypothetical protein
MATLPYGYNTYLNASIVAKAVVSNVPAMLFGWSCYSDTNDTLFVHLYNAAAAADVTVGTTVPLITIGMGQNTSQGYNNCEFIGGITFRTGIVIAATTTPNGSTFPAANLCIANLMYLDGIRRQGI